MTIAAFKTLEVSNQTEHFIIDALRTSHALTMSLVAEVGGRVVGHIALSVLEILISVYVHMRNRVPTRGANACPAEHLAVPVTDEQRNLERQELRNHVAAKAGSEEDQLKLDRIHWVIGHHGLDVSPEALERAQRSIKAYELEAIRKTEAAFLKATSRKADRLNLAYFFGILKNIQQQRDDEAKRQYCREHYNYQMMLDLDRRKNRAVSSAFDQ